MEELKVSYKKLKSSIYFDKTCSIVKDKIVDFEVNNLEKALIDIEQALKGDGTGWNRFIEGIIKKIEVYSFPKKVALSNDNTDKKNRIIINRLSKDTKVTIEGKDQIQYFIDLPVEGHLLSVLWILRLGKHIDSMVCEHSYGNRIQESEKKTITHSPYLFKPYFSEYESWRDKGLKLAEECYENKKDCVIIMLDIKRFYYSVNFSQDIFDELLKMCENEIVVDNETKMINKRLNDFIYQVIKEYSLVMKGMLEKDQVILPLGFMPSSILANWYLDEFDKNIINRVNPSYYGRYVDDIIIVDKVEKNSEMYEILNCEKVDFNKLIDKYFIECKPAIFHRHNNVSMVKIKKLKRVIPKLFIYRRVKCLRNKNIRNDVYKIKFTDKFHDNIGSLTIQEEKIKLLYLRNEGTKTLLDKFKSEIRKNSSEFRLLPEDNDLFLNGYSDIYKLNRDDSLNKLRSIEDSKIDKYELSKFIGKQLTIGNLIDDSSESKFYEDISKIYDNDVVIKNYTTWEATLSLCVINYRLDKFKELFKIIKESIEKLDVRKVDESELRIKSLKNTLAEYLKVCVTRTLALIWSKKVKELLEDLYEDADIRDGINEKRKLYCLTRMCNKGLMPILIDALINDKVNAFDMKIINDEHSAATKLNRLHDCLQIWSKFSKSKTCDLPLSIQEYEYHPYIVTYQDLNRLHVLCSIKNEEVVKDYNENDNFKSLKNEIEKMYLKINYCDDSGSKGYKTYSKRIDPFNKNARANVISVGNEKLKELRIAVATANLKEEYFKGVLTDSPVRTLSRYNELAEIINQAVKCKVDMLVLPENYVPYEWITLLEREAKKNNLAIITGVEHIKYGKSVYNLIATILPYKIDKDKYVYTNFRTKVAYSPEETRWIQGYRFQPIEGSEYNLFVWNNVWIPVYCCFEITSIIDRSIFYSMTDLFVAVEWNPDINYFSNILESLSRDMHCYCVQVNSAEYGDSCIIKPSKTDSKNIIRTKGGINNCILVGKIDIEALRDFQIKEYELQKGDKKFKPSPSGYNKNNVILRQKNELFKSLYNSEYGYEYEK
ncbi:MAG: reverse transcriptase domain-containing protein [Bacillota bacterium]|nr:reverse transcriptase domain-containing protein [Bacillota bacterium]